MLNRSSFRWLIAFALTGAACDSACLAADELDLPAIAELHFKEAAGYSMTLEGIQQPLELQKHPIFKWQNLSGEGVQLGAIYVWTRDGRPEVIGSMFSQAENGERNVIHEFHTLAQTTLIVGRPKDVKRQWAPKGTLAIQQLESATAVAQTPAKRLTQMRALANEFSGYTQNPNERIELRLAPQPLIRYQPTRPDVLDGALFAYLSSAAGTDPEFLLMVEARHPDPNSTDWAWHFGIVRFTERDLVVKRADVSQFSSVADPKLRVSIEESYRWIHNPDDTYVVFHAKFVPELTKPTKP